MISPAKSYVPCDLFANFLTHSFFNILDQYLAYTKHPTDTTCIQSLLQATQSFLFIRNQNPHAFAILDQNIFTHYLSFEELSQFKRKKPLRLSKIKKNYSQALLKSSSHESMHHCNETFIHLYYATLFSSFETQEDIPILYTLSSADAFIKEIKNIRHMLLKKA